MAKRKARRPVKRTAKKKSRKAAKSKARRPVRKPAKAAARRARSGAAKRKGTKKTVKATARRQSRPARTATPARRPSRSAGVSPGKSSRPKPPALQRERRRLGEEPVAVSVPSSLNFDRTASAAKSGRQSMLQHRREHTEVDPSMTGGDVDADWEDSYSEGDESPGGDNPTPDQDVVEEIGRALGVEYDDAEELKGADKITERDTNRWEYDPASAEDYKDRNKKQ